MDWSCWDLAQVNKANMLMSLNNHKLLCSCHMKLCHFQNRVFRWFKFTLKLPYSIVHDNLRLAIWDTSFWTFLLKFGHKGTWDISWDLFWSFLKYVNFWQFQGHLSTFQKLVVSENQSFLDERAIINPPYCLVLGGEVPRLNHGPICFSIQNT